MGLLNFKCSLKILYCFFIVVVINCVFGFVYQVVIKEYSFERFRKWKNSQELKSEIGFCSFLGINSPNANKVTYGTSQYKQMPDGVIIRD